MNKVTKHVSFNPLAHNNQNCLNVKKSCQRRTLFLLNLELLTLPQQQDHLYFCSAPSFIHKLLNYLCCSKINSNTVPLTSEISSLQFSTPSRNEKPHTSNKREILVVYQHKVDNNRKSSIRYLLDDCVADSSQDDRNTLELHPPNRQRPEVCSVQEGFAAPSLWSLFQIDWNNNCSTKKREHTVGMLADGNLRVRKSRGCGFLRVGSSQFRFQLLSENILFLIFSFLDHKDLCRMASVCRMLSRYANDEMIWAQLYSARYGVEGPDGTGWKQRYKERSSSHKISIFDLLSP
eukprot:TRINITY_DN925_c0_g1_i1.p1 TRINITY_DN925_c0_g1~~TRINITY_DN925_c0_g1_i1.p1  ORF type:complete len:291 (+),score=32.94 TRINITY_DN925_c0_g1_i1:295-1167(+)